MNVMLLSDSDACSDGIIPALRLGWPDLGSQALPYSNEVYLGLRDERPDLVILCSEHLDRMVWRAIIEVRRHSDVPIAVAVQQGDAMDMAGAIGSGADEFICLPCNPTLIIARVAALMRRVRLAGRMPGGWLDCGELDMNPRLKEASLGSERLALTPLEFNLLYLLASHRNATLPQEFISQVLWPGPVRPVGSLDMHVQRLQVKLRGIQKASAWIHRAGKRGYRLTTTGGHI